MEKRYQVFISSTFEDLANVRQDVSKALLRADGFPAGMELFPAADEEQFEYIKSVIKQSDYYIVISAGRYGAISPHDPQGRSYTELEYDYAVEIGIPVIRLLHQDPFKLLDKALLDYANSERLEQFRKKLMSGSLVNFWVDPLEVTSLAVLNLSFAIKNYPSKGWSRINDQILPETGLSDFQRDVLELAERDSNQKVYEILNTYGEKRRNDDTISEYYQKLQQVGQLFEYGLLYPNLEWTEELDSYKSKMAMSYAPVRITEFGRYVLKLA